MATHFVDHDGVVRFLGNVEPPRGLLRAWNLWGSTDAIPLIPRSEWPDRVAAFDPGPDHPFLPPVANQGPIGQCNAAATATAMESCRMEQGQPYVQLSAADIYHRISGGVDQGSTLEDGIHAAMTEGVATAATVPYLDWRGDHPQAAQERPKYRVLEAFLCPSFDHVFSSVICGYKPVQGVLWKQEYRPDKDGWLPQGRTVVGGHAIMGYKPAVRNGVYGVWSRNSWGAGWGLGGSFVLPEFAFSSRVGGFWCVRQVVDLGGQIPAPPA